jgi:hypothetical protein
MGFPVKRIIALAGSIATLVGSAGCSRHDAASAAPAASASATAADAATAEEVVSPIPQEMVDAVVNPQHLPKCSGPTGSVEGTVLVTGPPAPERKIDARTCPAAIDTYRKLFRDGTPAEPNGPRPLADAVVIAVGYAGCYIPESAPAKKVTISPNCAYPTRTLTVTFGQRLEIGNQSKYPFAPILESQASPAVMMAAPLEMGDPIRLYPRHPGHEVMTDFMQPYAQEDLYALRYPLHTVSDLSGHYRIDGVPVGKMSVRALHPTVGSEAATPVEIKPNVVTKMDITLEYVPQAPKVDPTHQQPIR